jgi:hypothetical protein
MGIDIYAEWRGQTDAERRAQTASWLSEMDGTAGCLQETYYEEPYATERLCPEAFDPGGVRIPAATLRERLPETLRIAEVREREIYNSSDAEIEKIKESYRQFVALCERKEQETGESVLIKAWY